MPACLPACLPFTHTLCCSLDLISLPLRALPPCGCHVHAAIILVVVPAKVGLSCVCNPIRAASCMFSLLGCTVSCVHCLQAWPPVQQPLVCAAMYSSYVQLPHPLKRLQNSHCLACVMYENRRMHQPNQCVGMSGDQLHLINTSECPYCAGVLRGADLHMATGDRAKSRATLTFCLLWCINLHGDPNHTQSKERPLCIMCLPGMHL